MRPALAALALALGALGPGCARPGLPPPRSGLDLQHVLRARRARSEIVRTAAATRLYRDVVATVIATECRLVPSDSALFDERARRCGATRAGLLGLGRLLLEVSAGPDFLVPVDGGARVRFVDLPPASWCGP